MENREERGEQSWTPRWSWDAGGDEGARGETPSCGEEKAGREEAREEREGKRKSEQPAAIK